MTTLHDRIYDSLHNGLNLKLLLEATGLDRNTFAQYLDADLWTSEQVRAIKETIKEWQDGN